jgi:predicted subunit of tRNA(5-methylaminomethyl-2-thiouridylate) methyltransferase
MASKKVNFATFFAMWAEERRWDVPDIHWQACDWLEKRGNLAVLRCFRGFGKSTILAVYNAWRYYENPAYRILHQGDQDKTPARCSCATR